jgi:transposase InsO family protein
MLIGLHLPLEGAVARFHQVVKVTPDPASAIFLQNGIGFRLRDRPSVGVGASVWTPGVRDFTPDESTVGQPTHIETNAFRTLGRTLGRPWLTLAIDVASRVVTGFHVTFEPPSSLTVALALTQAVLPKITARSDFHSLLCLYPHERCRY